MQVMQHPQYRPFKMPAWPVWVDGKAARVGASPMLGEHTDGVLVQWIGLSEADVADLRAAGAIG